MKKWLNRKTIAGVEEDLAAIELSLKNVKCQTETRKLNLEERESSQADAYVIMVVRGGEKLSALAYVDEVTEIIGCVERLLSEKRVSLQAKDSHWTKFKSTEKSLASALQAVLQKVQLITVDTNTLESLKKAADAVTDLSQSCSNIKVLKDEYNELGRCGY